MPINNRRYLVIAVILFIASLAIFRIDQAKGKVFTSASLSRFPLELGQWEGKDLEISNDVYEILGTKDVLLRRYNDKDGDSVYLTVVYSGKRRDSFHPPEYCYLGGGAKLKDKGKEDVTLEDKTILSTNRLILEDSRGGIRAWYWYLAEGKFVPSYYLQQIYLALDALRGNELKGALIRVSLRGPQSLDNKAKSFIKEVAPALRSFFHKGLEYNG